MDTIHNKLLSVYILYSNVCLLNKKLKAKITAENQIQKFDYKICSKRSCSNCELRTFNRNILYKCISIGYKSIY